MRIFRNAALKESEYPPDVTHALDYFIWAALDDHILQPAESRRISDDEHYYNDILNRHFCPGLAKSGALGRANYTLPRFPPLDPTFPHYFPEQSLHVVTKDWHVIEHFGYRVNRLEKAAELGEPVASGVIPEDYVAIQPSAYSGYYQGMREGGLLFSDASPEAREAVCVFALKAAVLHPADAGGWSPDDDAVLMRKNEAKYLVADFLEPEALMAWRRPAS